MLEAASQVLWVGRQWGAALMRRALGPDCGCVFLGSNNLFIKSSSLVD